MTNTVVISGNVIQAFSENGYTLIRIKCNKDIFYGYCLSELMNVDLLDKKVILHGSLANVVIKPSEQTKRKLSKTAINIERIEVIE